MNTLPEEIICHILNNLKNTVDVINFSLSCRKYRKFVLQNKDIFDCVSTFNNKFDDEIDKLNIIGKLRIINPKNLINIENIIDKVVQLNSNNWTNLDILVKVKN